jgi:hypothetical protein
MQGIELLGSLSSILGAALFAVLNAHRIEGPTNDVITNSGKILHAATANEDYGVLLEIVPDTRDVRGHFNAIREADSSHLSQSRVRLLGRRGINAHADTPLLRTTLQRRTARFILGPIPTHSDQLVKRGQDLISSKQPSYDLQSPHQSPQGEKP